MNKKFFSLLLLVASMAMTSAFGKALTIANNNDAEITHVVVTFAPSMFDQTSDLSVNSLNANQTGVSELEGLDRVKLYKVTYQIGTETITLDFKGKEVFLPATVNLTDITTKSVTYAENVAGRTQAEEDAILNRAAVVARNAKNTVVASFVDTKDWIAEKAVDLKDAALSVTHNAAQAIADKTAPAITTVEEKTANVKEAAHNVATDVKTEALEAKHTAEEKATETKHDLEEKTQQVTHRTKEAATIAKDLIQEKALEVKHAVQETATNIKHTAEEVVA